MSEQELKPLTAYVLNRGSATDKIMQLTCCSRDDAKNLFIACVYGGNEYGWLRRMNIHEHELCAKLSALVCAFRKCAHNVRKVAIRDCPAALLDLFGPGDPDQLWHQILVAQEDLALQCIERCLEERHCRVCQLSYDGCFWLPPLTEIATWSARDEKALESAVNARLATLPGLSRYPLRFKIKSFQLPKVVGVIAALRQRIADLENENAALREG